MKLAFQPLLLLVSALACSILVDFSGACETPVYRYAMYRWRPAPYEVYCFHEAPLSDEQQHVGELLDRYGRIDATSANVVHIPVNLTQDPDLRSVPPDVKRAWIEREPKALPIYYLASPQGMPLGFEQLDAAGVEALIESPARKNLAAQLELGKLGVFVLLTGADEQENQAAEAILSGLVDDVRQGRLSLYASPTQAARVAASDGEAGLGFDLGFIRLDRSSEEERWFVRTLLALEPDLTAEQRPQVFLVYGRARALLPYIGQGITRENLIREIEFISGACSCTVKEQNPGVDLLVRYDWESAATALAAKFGAEEGNEQSLGPSQFFPDLLLPAAPPAAAGRDEVEPTETESEATAAEEEPAALELATPAAAQETEHREDTATATASEVAAVTSPAVDREASIATSTASSHMIWRVGAGIAVALLVLFSLTFVVLRPR